jgi:hypothetical protein
MTEQLRCPECGYETQFHTCLRCGASIKSGAGDNSEGMPIKHSAETIEPDYPGAFPNITTAKSGGLSARFKNSLLHIDSDINALRYAGRVLLFLALLVWSKKFVFSPIRNNYAMSCFLHTFNLFIHEAGHIFFRPLGQFMTALGGSLTQLIIPLVFVLAFLIKNRDPFASSISLWWLGESLLDLVPYIRDARSLKLRLLSGVNGRHAPDSHDWHFILRKLHWLKYDYLVATIANVIGIALMLCALAWGGFLLYKQFKALIKKKPDDLPAI